MWYLFYSNNTSQSLVSLVDCKVETGVSEFHSESFAELIDHSNVNNIHVQDSHIIDMLSCWCGDFSEGHVSDGVLSAFARYLANENIPNPSDETMDIINSALSIAP